MPRRKHWLRSGDNRVVMRLDSGVLALIVGLILLLTNKQYARLLVRSSQRRSLRRRPVTYKQARWACLAMGTLFLVGGIYSLLLEPHVVAR